MRGRAAPPHPKIYQVPPPPRDYKASPYSELRFMFAKAYLIFCITEAQMSFTVPRNQLRISWAELYLSMTQGS